MRNPEKLDIGATIKYKSTDSTPFKDRDKYDGVLHQIYIVELISGKVGDTNKEAKVRYYYNPAIFDYEEEVGPNLHVIQAIKHPTSGGIKYRLLTGQAKVYGRVIFKNGKHYRELTIRSRLRYERYIKAVEIITPTSPGPHSLKNVDPTEHGKLFTFTTRTGSDRTVEFIRATD